MAANHLSKEQRQEIGRQTQRRLRARIAEGSLPADYYAQLGRKGFRVALLRHGPEHLAKVLSVYYNKVIDARLLERNREREREYEQTRRAYPLDGQVCARCGKPATERDHAGAEGWRGGHEPGTVVFLCRDCHVAVEVARVKAGVRPAQVATPAMTRLAKTRLD